jgi:hypothetical protein
MFSAEEDNHLKLLVAQIADPDWKQIAAQMTNRTARQCRERYKNYLSPDLSTRPWNDVEDVLLREKVRQFGPRWAQISHFFPGRSDVGLKNRWSAISAGIDDRRPGLEAAERPEEKPPPPAAPPPEKSETVLAPFLFTEPLWSKEEQMLILRGDGGPANSQLLSTFRNYGGRIW